MARNAERRHRRGVAVLAALGLLLQALSGLFPSASSGAVAASPLGTLVVCTPDGIRILDPDGAPLEVPENDAPTAAGDPCQICCLSNSCCQGLLGETAAEVFAAEASPSFAACAPASALRLFSLAKPGRGPPPVRT